MVIFIQENRSFDHYFGSYRGVRGFADQSLAFQQPDSSNTTDPPIGKLLPFHLDTSMAAAACTHDISHDWIPQHESWDNGAMDKFVTSRLSLDGNFARGTMGYYTRTDIPYYYAIADAFTICDNYFCSVMGPTDPNRLYSMAASIDPDGKNGGPLLVTLGHKSSDFFRAVYLHHDAGAIAGSRHFLESLFAAGREYPEQYFVGQCPVLLQEFSGSSSELYKNAFGPQFPKDFPGGCRVRKFAASFLGDRVAVDTPTIPRDPLCLGKSPWLGCWQP